MPFTQAQDCENERRSAKNEKVRSPTIFRIYNNIYLRLYPVVAAIVVEAMIA